MYRKFFNLTKKPFSLAPDPEFLYLSANHARASEILEYGLMSHAGFTVLTGEIGSGKTTIVHHLLSELTDDIQVGFIFNTHSSMTNLMDWILDAFDIKCDSHERTNQHRVFSEYVHASIDQGQRILLVIDEAQNLSLEMLEELRLLSNLNLASQVYFQLILLGQPQLLSKLNDPDLVQFAQRIGVEFHLRSMSLEDTRAYIRHRLKVAGTEVRIFEDDAVDVLYCFSHGVPRVINSLCDMSLVYAFADEKKTVDIGLVFDVVRDRSASSFMMKSSSRTDDVQLVFNNLRLSEKLSDEQLALF